MTFYQTLALGGAIGFASCLVVAFVVDMLWDALRRGRGE